MRLSPTSRWTREASALGLILFLWTAALVAGCSSVDHIAALRDAQDDFSEAARQENMATIGRLFPDREALDRLMKGADTAGSRASEEASLESYARVAQRLKALESSRQMALKRDGLHGQVVALRLFAEWRASFYAHLLRVKNEAIGLDEGANASEAGDEREHRASEAMTGIARRAEQASRDANLAAQLYPRDAFLLRFLPELIDYDTALIRYYRARHLQDREQKEKEMNAVIAEMLGSENAIAQKKPSDAERDFETYRWISRLTMLMTARKIAAGNAALRLNNAALNARAKEFGEALADSKKSAPLRALLEETHIKPPGTRWEDWIAEKFAPLGGTGDPG